MKELQSLDDVFNKKIFRIPDYQRGYAWGEKQLTEFWEDLLSLDISRSHYTGVISIKEVPKEIWQSWNDEKWLIETRQFKPYYVVDGQQRLTTISIFLQCLVEAVQNHPENKGNNDVFLGSYELSEILKDYIAMVEPKHQTFKTYKFGYEADNPSFDFLRYRIFNEKNPGTLKETFYTLNLENAKKFFAENIAAVVAKGGLNSLSPIYEKLTQNFLFNVYEIDDNFDVFVAFETMNNRGKRLSDLELLKNRLIYLTTLYPKDEVSIDVQESTRRKINDTWGEIYNQLGRNKSSPLNDDEFLRAHWVIYFKYSRKKGDDYISFLLDEYFSPKSIVGQIEVKTGEITNVEEVIDSIEADDDDFIDERLPPINSQQKLSIKDINDYIDSLKSAAKIWYATFFPDDSSELSNEEKIAMDRLNRVKIAYFRPLIMAMLLKNTSGDGQNLLVLNEIERFIFICFRLCRAASNYCSSEYYRAAKSIYSGEMTLPELLKSLNEKLSWVFEDGEKLLKTSDFDNFINKKFGLNGDGFYAWKDLHYFIYEYEEALKAARGQPKLGWQNFIRHEKDKISIEHIYPQTANSEYWVALFGSYTAEQQRYLKGSLGNLLPLSSSINSSLQNDDFPDKKTTKRNESGKVTRNGYENGSYSELDVAKKREWTPVEILSRGLVLLEFLESRWRIDLGGRDRKTSLLHINFLETQIGDEEVPSH